MSSPSPPAASTQDTVPPPISSITSSSVTGSNYISSISSDADDTDSDQSVTLAPRPRLDTRMSNDTNIVPRDHPDIELRTEVYSPNDARAMSPRRTSLEIEKLGEDARKALQLWVFFLYVLFPLSESFTSRLKTFASLSIAMAHRVDFFFLSH